MSNRNSSPVTLTYDEFGVTSLHVRVDGLNRLQAAQSANLVEGVVGQYLAEIEAAVLRQALAGQEAASAVVAKSVPSDEALARVRERTREILEERELASGGVVNTATHDDKRGEIISEEQSDVLHKAAMKFFDRKVSGK